MLRKTANKCYDGKIGPEKSQTIDNQCFDFECYEKPQKNVTLGKSSISASIALYGQRGGDIAGSSLVDQSA